MPKRKRLPKLPNYTGLPRTNDEMLVQKTNPLQSLSETDMTLPEFKILDAYLSRIDSHKPNKRYVRLEKGELEQILGISRILKSDLEKRLDNLFTAVTIRDPDKPKGFTKIGLFAKAEAKQDDDGLWQIDLACTSEAMEYIFNPENLGYLKYRLKNVIELTSRYSYVLYLYLEKNKFRGNWTISLNELKQLLRCTAERYTQYKFFNAEILKNCYKEINAKTDCHFEYEAIKHGRRVTEIRFIYQSQNQIDGQLSLDDISNTADIAETDDEEKWQEIYGSEDLAILAEACHYEFDKAQMEQIMQVLTRIDIAKDYQTDSLIWGRERYLREKYATLCVASEQAILKKKPIKHRLQYFLAMLEKDTYMPVTGYQA